MGLKQQWRKAVPSRKVKHPLSPAHAFVTRRGTTDYTEGQLQFHRVPPGPV
jgi:hypothetical protein